ncbi:hypothetical protein HPB48_011823 [Haemaphysalis longicornis]|uniref:Uncharacterized protein n=1 Tax=Haemaphysalis longicornis TaxID=44386 RepID=A0A9J6GBA6_HAELO|nr:hypothetical protein HPB48_011823 [Haemaphysalis longicornis]
MRKKKRDFEENGRAASTMSFNRNPPRRNGNPTGALKRLTTEARLSKLPEDHFRVIVHPRDGIGVKKMDKMTFMKAIAMATGVSYEQRKHDMLCPIYEPNTYNISTPRMENDKAYVQLEELQIGGKTCAAAVYLAAQKNACKGVTRGVGLVHTDKDLAKMFVNKRNPTILDAKRIQNAKAVVLLINGMKVPGYVMIGDCLVQCSLFRSQHDVRYASGKAGHRADVCINPIGSASGSGASRKIYVTRCSKAKQNKKETAPRCQIARGDAASNAAPARTPQLAQKDGARSHHKATALMLRPEESSAQDPSAAAAPCSGEAPAEEPPPPRYQADQPRGTRPPLKDPARENEARDNRTWADRAADAKADNPPRDREEKQGGSRDRGGCRPRRLGASPRTARQPHRTAHDEREKAEARRVKPREKYRVDDDNKCDKLAMVVTPLWKYPCNE